MADYDRTRGYRDSSEAHRRSKPQSSSEAGDPLAELARLIGQQNEAAAYQPDVARSPYGAAPEVDRGWTAPSPSTQRDEVRSEPASYATRSYSSDQTAGRGYGGIPYDSRYNPRREQEARQSPAPQTPGAYEPSYADPQYADPQFADQQYADQSYDPRYDPQYDAPQYPADSGYAADPRDPRYAEPHYEQGAAQGYGYQGYADPRYADPRYADSQYSDPRYAGPQYADPQYSDPNVRGYPGQVPSAYGHQQGDQPYANSYLGGAPMVPPPPPVAAVANERMPAKRGNIVTVLAVLALAVVGTAAAYGYRAMFGGAGTPVPPPVIQADVKPSKVVPATDENSKPIQDRIGVKTERIVPRQEEPVQQAAPGQPRVISPWLAGQSPQSFPAASANAPRAATPQAPIATEPKRIRTVPIKPEQGSEAPAARNARNAAVEPERDTSQTGSVPSSQRQAARNTQTASLPDGSGAPFPAPITSPSRAVPTTAAAAYGVQVTSQRSEADAQASFRSLQQQFPSVLGNRQPVIRRADLGQRGTYYRAQVPFQSQSEANEFCSSLKAAGGQCVVQRN